MDLTLTARAVRLDTVLVEVGKVLFCSAITLHGANECCHMPSRWFTFVVWYPSEWAVDAATMAGNVQIVAPGFRV